VLPGAFSTFRWDCINGVPLETFLLGAKDEFGDIQQIVDCSKANKYLAEDRIMCLEIITKEKEKFIIHYIPGAKCLTDPPMTLTELLKQRRRWFNGSMFATFHVLTSMCRIWKRQGSCIRNIWFMLLYLYMIIQTILSFVLVGLFYGAFSIFIRKALPDDDCLNIFKAANLMENLYLIFLLAVLLLSITVDVKYAETGYRVCSFAMGCFSILMVVSTILYAINVDSGDSSANYVLIFIAVWLLSYIMPLFLNITKLKIEDFIKGVIYCSFLSPTYVNIFTIFAVSNIHDVSWGSRPTVIDPMTAKVEGKKQEIYKNYRANFLVLWILVNLATGGTIITLSRNGNEVIIFYVSLGLGIIIAFKIILALIHSIMS
jgi:chitin synthase